MTMLGREPNQLKRRDDTYATSSRDVTAALNAAVETIDEAFAQDRRLLQPIWALFSGGYDSLTACLVAEQHPRFAGVVHVRTGIGVDETYEYVRDVARSRGWHLHIFEPRAGSTYEDLTGLYGMPGPGFHTVPYRWLKERQIESFTRLVKADASRMAHVALISGARATESQRRSLNMINGPIWKRPGHAQVYISPIIDWAKADCLNAIEAANVPKSEVVATIHKSGECLCGAFGSPAELQELAVFWPGAARRIRVLEQRARDAGKRACRWGVRPPNVPDGQLEIPGPLCVGCA